MLATALALASCLIGLDLQANPAPRTGPPAPIALATRPTPAPPTGQVVAPRPRVAATPKPPRPTATPPKPAVRPSARPAQPVRVPTSGPGSFRRAQVDLPGAARRGRVIRYTLSVERGLALDAEQQARFVQQVLDDPRSWRGSGRVRFRLVSSPQRASVRAYIATPRTTDRLCAPLRTRGEVSCQNGNRVVLNARRWVHGAKSYGKAVQQYRRYLVNHEFGHLLGRQHVGCRGSGKRASVMMQQTKGLRGCRANPWPAPGR